MAKTLHPWRWVAVVVIAVLFALLVHSVATNPNFQFGVVADYFFDSRILDGLLVTLELTCIAMVVGIALGVLLAVLRMSPNPVMAGAARFYIWIFRGTPVLVQLLFWFNLAALYPRLSIGIPFGPQFVSGSSNALISAFTAAILGLGLNEGAYMAEIVRAGILSVGQGQTEAAQALGMHRLLILRRVVLPQAMRVLIPPTGNQVISMLKGTSLVSVIAVSELLYSAQLIYAVTYQTIPLLIVASAWYLIFTTLLTVVQNAIERHYGRSDQRPASVPPWRRVGARLRVRSNRTVGA